MWSSRCKNLIAKYANGGTPTDDEYGIYVFYELMELGFVTRKLTMAGAVGCVLAIDIARDIRIVVCCRSVSQNLTALMVNQMLSLKQTCPAARYFIWTNGKADHMAETLLDNNHIDVIGFKLGDNVVDALVSMQVIPGKLGALATAYQTVSNDLEQRRKEEQERIAAEAAERERAEEEERKRKASLVDPIEKYKAGMYDPLIKDAVCAVVCMRNGVVSVGGLARAMKIDYEKASGLLLELEELEVVSHQIGNAPRDVIMTPGVANSKLGVNVSLGLGSVK